MSEDRAKYNAAQLKELGSKGHAFKNEDGSYSFPIDDLEDLKNAIHAVGRAGADHDAVRKYIIGRAKAMGQSDLIPENWGADGSLQQANSEEPVVESVAEARPRKAALSPRELRTVALQGIQVRSISDTEAHFVGYASTTDTPYDVTDFMGSYRETIAPGAFVKTLRETPNVPLLFNHDGLPVASTASGTMTLSEDRNGLKVEASLDRRQSLANDLCIALERGDLSQMSFSFSAVKQAWNQDYSERTVQELRLFDASIVTYPANPTTTAALRSAFRSALGDDGRGRLLAVAKVLGEVREGKVISQANQELLERALTALSAADDNLSQVTSVLTDDAMSPNVMAALDGIDQALDEGQQAISSVLDVANPDGGELDQDDSGPAGSNDDGSMTPGSADGDPNQPADGAGARSLTPARRAQLEDEMARLRRRPRL